MEELIRRYHAAQYRNNRKCCEKVEIPYTDHLYGVASILELTRECPDPQDMIQAALGHDLLEDTSVAETEIAEAANRHVLELIRELTNPVDDAHTDRYMRQLSTASEEARLVKYADLIENTSSVAYNIYILGKEWTDSFYLPILTRTTEILAETSFPTYPETAGEMRRILKVYSDLLMKKRNALRET